MTYCRHLNVMMVNGSLNLWKYIIVDRLPLCDQSPLCVFFFDVIQ